MHFNIENNALIQQILSSIWIITLSIFFICFRFVDLKQCGIWSDGAIFVILEGFKGRCFCDCFTYRTRAWFDGWSQSYCRWSAPGIGATGQGHRRDRRRRIGYLGHDGGRAIDLGRGPGEAKVADIGLTGASPNNLAYVEGVPAQKIQNATLVDDLEAMVRARVALKKDVIASS